MDDETFITHLLNSLPQSEYEGAILVINNRILSKVQKSFWSCTHMNSFQKYALYVNLHILLNLIQKNSRYPRIKKIYQMIEKITRIDQKTKSLCLVIT